ncbi:MAG: hypothetical protein NTV05_08145 [Acidobacteria bacterium]|nr:hypothetical protein [Acidobacteriota bacterium]
MVALFLLGWVFAGHYLQSLAQGAQTSPPDVVGPASEKRMFDIRSRQAWDAVQRRLVEIGFSSDKTDRANQVVLTKWRDVGDKGMEWLVAPALPQTYVTKRIRFEVFVSPFAEPARVHVGSIMEETSVGRSRS